MCPACLRAAGGARAERGKFFTLTIACHEGRPPMPSSPIPAARSQYLLDLLAQVPDPRKKCGRRHPLAGLLAVGIAAVVVNIAAANRHHARDPQRTLKLIQAA